MMPRTFQTPAITYESFKARLWRILQEGRPFSVDGSEIRRSPPGMHKTNVNNGINYKSTGAGFFASTVSTKKKCLPTIDFQGIVVSLWGSKEFRNLSRTFGRNGKVSLSIKPKRIPPKTNTAPFSLGIILSESDWGCPITFLGFIYLKLDKTPWKINIEPENDGLEDDLPLPGVSCQVPC